jgi:hypothetical protein
VTAADFDNDEHAAESRAATCGHVLQIATYAGEVHRGLDQGLDQGLG